MDLLPRVVRQKDAPKYCGVNTNYFNRYIRPHLREIRFGPQMVGFDRIDIDQWIVDFKDNSGRLGHGKEEENKPCRRILKSQGSSCEGKPGGLTSESMEREFAKAVKRAITKKPQHISSIK